MVTVFSVGLEELVRQIHMPEAWTSMSRETYPQKKHFWKDKAK